MFTFVKIISMPVSFTGFGGWALLLMLLAGIVHHLLSQHKAKKHLAK